MIVVSFEARDGVEEVGFGMFSRFLEIAMFLDNDALWAKPGRGHDARASNTMYWYKYVLRYCLMLDC